MADRTPESRNRVADFLRAASIVVVVLGHWLAAVPYEVAGRLTVSHALELDGRFHYLTWALQVMPVFFVVGGYSNGKSLAAARRDALPRRVWLAARYRRLITPIVPFLLVWSALVPVLGQFVDLELLKLGSQVAAVPLWFLAVYLVAVAAAPWTYLAWRRWGVWSLVVPAGVAVVWDVLRLAGIGAPAWSNYAFVWLAIHQVGYLWAEHDRLPAGRWAAALSGAGLAALVGLTVFGPYPVALIGVPGEPFSNTTPPTVVLFALTAAQIGLVGLIAAPLRRLLARRSVWATVVLVSGMIMSIYVWHLTAMVLTIGAAVLAGNVGFAIEPLTAAWWLTRPVWFAVLAVPLLGLVAVFGRYESRVRSETGPPPRPWALAAGIVLSSAALAASAAFGVARVDDFPLRWWVPLLLIGGTFLAGMFTLFPARGAR